MLQKIRSRTLSKTSDHIMVQEKDEFLNDLFGEAITAIENIQENAEYGKVLKDLPKS